MCIETALVRNTPRRFRRVFPAFVNSVDVKREREAERESEHAPANRPRAKKEERRGNREQRVGLDAIRDEEHQIRERLVSSDRHTRDKTFERLRKWLCSQKTLDHPSMKKVWKALFYAMWHSDGREVQRELATSIAAVMHSLKSQMAILYASVFFWTMRNEWAGIDKHRQVLGGWRRGRGEAHASAFAKERLGDECESKSGR